MRGLFSLMFFLILSSISLVAQNPLRDHLVAYYPLDGDAQDLSGNCLNGVVNGASGTLGIGGEFLTAMHFDGVDDYIEIPHSESFNFGEESDFAISFWVKKSGYQMDLDTTDNDIISKWVRDDDSMAHLEDGYPFTFRVSNQKFGESKLVAAQFGGYKTGCEDGTTMV